MIESYVRADMHGSEQNLISLNCILSSVFLFISDLDRTSSETLRQEFQEYVSVRRYSGSQSGSGLPSPVSAASGNGNVNAAPGAGVAVSATQPGGEHTALVSGSASSSASYTARLEFALKLGYTERQVRFCSFFATISLFFVRYSFHLKF